MGKTKIIADVGTFELKQFWDPCDDLVGCQSVVGCPFSATHSRIRKRWKFPNSRFITYEDSDELWARPLGFGHEELVLEQVENIGEVVNLRETEDGLFLDVSFSSEKVYVLRTIEPGDVKQLVYHGVCGPEGYPPTGSVTATIPGH